MGYDISFSGKFMIEPALHQEQVSQLKNLEYRKHGQEFPSSYCHWTVSQDGKHLYWNQQEKFGYFKEWLTYLLENFFKPWRVTLKGSVSFDGQDGRGSIRVKNGKALIQSKESVPKENADYWINHYREAAEGSDFKYYALSQVAAFAHGADMTTAIHFYHQEFANASSMEVKKLVIDELKSIVEQKSPPKELLRSIIDTFGQALVLSEKNQAQTEGQYLAFITIIAVGACKEKATHLRPLILPWLHNNDPNIVHYAIRTLAAVSVGPDEELAHQLTPLLTHEYAFISIAAREAIDKLKVQ